MKILILSSMALVGLLLVGLQHQQIGQLRAENTALQQASAEAGQLKADLAKSTGNEAQDAEEIDRLREENRDLLKLRNEVSQLRDAREEFQKVNAENQRLQSLAKNAPHSQAKQASMQPILIRIHNLYDRGLSTPEAAVETLLWAEHAQNFGALSRCIVPEQWPRVRELFERKGTRDFYNVVSIEIVARRDIDATTVQLGIQFHSNQSGARDNKVILQLSLRNGEWKFDNL
jgi:hypothetical protein